MEASRPPHIVDTMNISRHIGLLSVGVLAGLVVLVSFLLTRAPDPELDAEPVVVNVVPSTAVQSVAVEPAPPPPPAPIVPYDDDWDDGGNWDNGGNWDDDDWDDDDD
jgi:hypothetical protein